MVSGEPVRVLDIIPYPRFLWKVLLLRKRAVEVGSSHKVDWLVSFLLVEVLGLQVIMTSWFILKGLFGGVPVVVMHRFISPLLVGK